MSAQAILAQLSTINSNIAALQNNVSSLLAFQSQVQAGYVPLSAGSNLNSGDTAWMLTSTAIVLMMTLPGVALFYGGMCQAKNVLSTVMQSYSIACLITIMWFMFTYSLCFSNGHPVIGNADRFWLVGTQDVKNQQSPYRLGPSSAQALDATVPESVYMTFQLTFAIITGALVCGSFVERMRFSAMIVFIFFWHILVYCPVCHSEWALDGFLAVAGDLDFAGGNVVHICSGLSGLAASVMIGPRKGWGVVHMKPHNIVYTVIGGSLLWVGWFGFNAGSAGTAGERAGFAMMVTQICTGTSGFVWMLLEYAHKGKPSVLGIVSGTVTGLVIITPASGFVDHTAAFMMGVIGTPVVYLGVQVKHRMGYDDALDAFHVHGVGGMCGGLLTGFFANDFVTGSQVQKGVFYGRGVQVGYQLYGMIVIGAWSFFMSLAILAVLRLFMPLRVSEAHEEDGLDISEHGETMMEAGEASEHGKLLARAPSAPSPAAGATPGGNGGGEAPPGAAGKVAPLEVISNCDK